MCTHDVQVTANRMMAENNRARWAFLEALGKTNNKAGETGSVWSDGLCNKHNSHKHLHSSAHTAYMGVFSSELFLCDEYRCENADYELQCERLSSQYF